MSREQIRLQPDPVQRFSPEVQRLVRLAAELTERWGTTPPPERPKLTVIQGGRE